MKISLSSRLLPWAGAILLSCALTLGILEATRLSLENDYQEALAIEVIRRGFEVMAQTMDGNVMGAVSALGLVDLPIKSVARGEIPLDTPLVMESLQAIGRLYEANGAYLVNPDGIIKSSWDTVNVPLTIAACHLVRINLSMPTFINARLSIITRDCAAVLPGLPK